MDILPFEVTVPPFSNKIDYQTLFKKVRNNYTDTKKKVDFSKLPAGLMVYKTVHEFGESIGLIGLTGLHQFYNGKILKHEHILSKRKHEQWLILKERGALVKPVLLTYYHHHGLETILQELMKNEPLTHLEEGKEQHILWHITEPDVVAAVQETMQQIPDVMIADGHHRLASLEQLKQAFPSWNQQFMCIFMSAKYLSIKSFSRVLKVKPTVWQDMQRLLHAKLVITPLEKPFLPTSHQEMVFKYQDQYFLGKWNDTTLKKYPINILDVQLLEKEIFQPLGYTRDAVQYLDGTFNLDTLQNYAKKDTIIFVVTPPTFEEVYEYVKQGDVLPPKTTWFAPRIKNGLTIQSFSFL